MQFGSWETTLSNVMTLIGLMAHCVDSFDLELKLIVLLLVPTMLVNTGADAIVWMLR